MGASGLGIGGANTSGVHQSALSVSAAPPEDPIMYLPQLFALGFGILGFLYGWIIDGSLVLGFLGAMIASIGGGFFGILVAIFHPKTEYKRRMQLWQKTRMCTRCGCLYTLAE